MTPPRDNPFRIDRVSTLPFLDGDEDLIPRLADRVGELKQAAIVGPHGVGKSTLLRTLGDTLADRGERVVRISLPGSATASQRAAVLDSISASTLPAVVLLDGYEQLSRWQRFQARWRFPRLIVTAHAISRSVPTLITLRPTTQTIERVLAELLGNVPPDLAAVAEAAFHRHGGNVRETLFELYDRNGTPLAIAHR